MFSCTPQLQPSVVEIVDVATLHQRLSIDSDISGALAKSRSWTGWITIPPDHIYSKLEAKATAYARLTEVAQVPFTIAMYGEFTASIEPEDVLDVCKRARWWAVLSLPFRERSHLLP